MSRRLAVAVFLLLALTVAPAAAGDGPMPFAQEGGSGVLAAGGLSRWAAVGTSDGSSTVLELIDTKGGTVQRFVDLAGAWGVPMVTAYSADGGGVSTDGKTIVLADVTPVFPRTTSSFIVVNTGSLLVRRTIHLKGDFAFDVLSPDASRLYLVQHVDQNDTSKYVVRAYDVTHGRLLPGRIADRAQKGWVMKGYPVSRATSSTGRWVYTLYDSPGGFPFVHALDTVRGVAHCVGLPWWGSQNAVYNMRLTLRNGDRTLAVHWLSGRPWLAVSTGTWRISHDSRGFPWPSAAAAALGVGALAAGALLLLRRRRREEFEQELVDLLRLPEREVVV